MTDKAFRDGMARLLVALPDRDKDAAELGARSKVYREVCDFLPDDAWHYAVAEALRYERWFPAPATLLDYANDFTPPPKALLAERLPDVEERRTKHIEGASQLRAELVQRGLLRADAQAPVSSMPRVGGSHE